MSIDTESSVVRVQKLDSTTFLYRFQTAIQAKNISDTGVFIPAMVVEFFKGTLAGDILKNDQAFLVNQPYSFLEKDQGGNINWTRLVAAVQRVPEIDDPDITDKIKNFPQTAGAFVGNLDSGGSAHWNADFVLRASPADMAGTVITFWSKGESDPYVTFVTTRTELLSEAEDAFSFKTQSTTSPPTSPNVPSPTN